jgi:ubiquitin carboxyl-terminal hydrolase 7
LQLTLFYQLAENDMLVDDYDQYPAEKTDVVVVSRSGSDEPESPPAADDRMFFVASLSLHNRAV